MIKLNCGVSRKVGEPAYGSRGATCNVELELESSASQDTQLLHDRIRKLFAVARSAVDEELGLTNGNNGKTNPAAQPGPKQPTAQPKNGNTPRPATESQIRAINAICERLGLNADEQARQRYKHGLADLSLPEASAMIDALKNSPPPGQQ